MLVTCLRCFQTPTEQQTGNSEPQWRSICRRIKKCTFKFHFISSSSCQELNGKDLIWLGTTDKKNLFAEPVVCVYVCVCVCLCVCVCVCV